MTERVDLYGSSAEKVSGLPQDIALAMHGGSGLREIGWKRIEHGS